MKKRAYSLILSLVLALSLLPCTALAAGSAMETKNFPAGKIETPLAPYLFHEPNDSGGDSIHLWYNMPKDLLALADDYNKWYESDASHEGFLAQFGVEDYSVKLQVDARVDGGAWRSDAEWNDPDWGGTSEPPHYLAFECSFDVSGDTRNLYNEETISWLTYLSEGEYGFLAPIVTTTKNEYDENVYHFDLTNHTLGIRTRYMLRIQPADGEARAIFSDWSPETSIGKGGNLKTLTKPASLAAPVLSDFSVTLNSEGGREARYYLDVPDSIYEALVYAGGQENIFEPIAIQAQVRVNGGAWQDVYTANPVWIFSNYRAACPDEGIKESDAVEVRVRFESSALGLISDWSNIVGTSALMASDWAKTELAEADRLGLIPESLKGQDLTRPITRQEFAAISVKVYESLTGGPADAYTGSSPFADTKDAEVLKAFALGVTNGADKDKDGNTLFVPNMQLNRETLATMLTRVYKKYAFDGWTLEKDADFTAQFREEFTMPEPFADDKDISNWAKDSVYFMNANKIVGGVGDGKFAPRAVTTAEQAAGYAVATREAALVMAYRMVKNLG